MAEETSAVWHGVILRITGFFRRRRAQLLVSRFPELPSCLVCDLGGSRHFWQSTSLASRPRRVEVLNISMEDINAAGVDATPEDADFLFEVYDGSSIPRQSDYYDLLICNSVLEHVPPARRHALAKEMLRVSPRLFVQTPAKGFVIDPHFLMPLVHWVPRRWGRHLAAVSPWRLLTRSDRAHTNGYFDGTQLLGRRELMSYYPTGRLVIERFLGMPKSYVIVVDGR